MGELRRKKPAELHDLAARIWELYASTGAMVRLGQNGSKDPDELLPITIRFNRDLLDYFELDEAMGTGDVGRMEDMLPRLLFRFVGGNNNKYVVEVLELLQGLHREWTEEVKCVCLRTMLPAPLMPDSGITFANIVGWSTFRGAEMGFVQLIWHKNTTLGTSK